MWFDPYCEIEQLLPDISAKIPLRYDQYRHNKGHTGLYLYIACANSYLMRNTLAPLLQVINWQDKIPDCNACHPQLLNRLLKREYFNRQSSNHSHYYGFHDETQVWLTKAEQYLCIKLGIIAILNHFLQTNMNHH